MMGRSERLALKDKRELLATQDQLALKVRPAVQGLQDRRVWVRLAERVKPAEQVRQVLLAELEIPAQDQLGNLGIREAPDLLVLKDKPEIPERVRLDKLATPERQVRLALVSRDQLGLKVLRVQQVRLDRAVQQVRRVLAIPEQPAEPATRDRRLRTHTTGQ